MEIILKKVSPPLYQALGIFLPLITTNCAILGVAILAVQNEFNLVESVIYAFANAIGFGLALYLFLTLGLFGLVFPIRPNWLIALILLLASLLVGRIVVAWKYR